MVRRCTPLVCVSEIPRKIACPIPGLPTGFPATVTDTNSTWKVQTQCGRLRGVDEEAMPQQLPRGLSSPPAPSFLRPIGLKLKKSASLLEWLNKKLAEQGEGFLSTIEALYNWFLLHLFYLCRQP